MTIHAIERLAERYGIEASVADLREMGRLALSGEGILTRNAQGSFTSAYLIRWQGRVVRLLVNERGHVITALPPAGTGKVQKRNRYAGFEPPKGSRRRESRPTRHALMRDAAE